ncbi:MAG: hypothetical protein LUD19_06360 [Clostridia bacterium]|nr:hypothetical protein [Clostridia bacterium]
MCKRKVKSDKRKIYKTTDGYFNDKAYIKKPRRVAVVHQRKDDGAVAVVKIYSKKEKKGKAYINNLTLKPDKHSSITEDSVVGSQVNFGVKSSNNNYRAIKTRDLVDTGDKLTTGEYRKVKKGIQNDTSQHRKTYKNTVKKWKNHFRK